MITELETDPKTTPHPECFRCGAPARYKTYYHEACGRFVEGHEPWTCGECEKDLRGRSTLEVREFFAGFPVAPESEPDARSLPS